MADPIANGAGGLIVRSFQQMSYNIVGVIRSVFGAAPNDNESPAYYNAKGAGVGDSISMAATIGVTGIGTVLVDAGSDFVCTRITAKEVADDGVVLTTQASYLASIAYTGNAKFITFNPVFGSSIFGDGFQSVPLAKNWLIKRGSTIQVTLTNMKAVFARVFVTFHGWSVFDAGMLNTAVRR